MATLRARIEALATAIAGQFNALKVAFDLTGTGQAAPPAGVRFYVANRGGRRMPSFRGPNGRAWEPQPHLGRCKMVLVQANQASSSNPTQLGTNQAPSSVGTLGARTTATTSIFTRHRRQTYASAATAGSLAGLYQNVQHCYPGNGAGLGGYHLTMRFGCGDAAAVAGARQFCGIGGSAAAPANVEPSTLTNVIGVGHGAADTNLKLYYGGSAAQAPIDLGANFPANTLSTDMYELTIWASPDSQDVSWRVERINTGDVAEGTIVNTTPGTTLPASNTGMSWRLWRSNNATALAVNLDFATIALETDY